MEITQISLLRASLFCFILASADGLQSCPSGQYRFHNGVCTQCKSCGDLQVISPCSPTHDRVCADELQHQVFHFPCGTKLWGLFVEDKRRSFETTAEEETEDERLKICTILQRFQNRTLFGTHRRQERCGNGKYQWSKASKSPNSSLQVDCRPCSPCPNGTRVMSPCGGFQDTFCSFDRVSNTMEIFRMSCPAQGPTIQVYSSLTPSASRARLWEIQAKLQRRLCHALPPRVMIRKHRRGRKIKRKNGRKRGRKGRRGRKGGKRRNGTMGLKGRRRDQNRIHVKPRVSTADARLDSSHTSLPAVLRLGFSKTEKNGSVAVTKSSEVSKPTQSPNSFSKLKTATTSSTRSSTRLQVVNNVTVFANILRDNEVDLEEEENDEGTKSSATNHIIAVAPVLLGVLGLASVFVLRKAIQRKKCRNEDYIDDTVNDGFTEESLTNYTRSVSRIPEDLISSSQMQRIIDPLRLKNRTNSHDSGYITVSSQGSQRESRSFSQSIDPFLPPSVFVVPPTELARNAVSTYEVSHRGEFPTADVVNCTSGLKPGRVSTLVRMHADEELGDGRRTQSLSEDCSSFTDGRSPRLRMMTSIPWSFPPPYNWYTESLCCGDEGVESSQESVFQEMSGHVSNEVSRIPVAEEKYSAGKTHISCRRPSDESASEGNADSHSYFEDGQPQAPETLTEKYCESERISAARPQNNRSSAHIRRPLSFGGVPVGPQSSANYLKSRSPSSDSSSSSASSSVSMFLRIPLTLKNDLCSNENTDWLHKTSDVESQNFLSTYSSSTATQTEDWTKTNHRARPIFCTSWQGCKSFSAAGGTWPLPESDVTLEVPQNAVPAGSYVDITAATFTNLARVRQVLGLADDKVMVGPLVEFDAGSGIRFQQHVQVFLPHCLPPGVSEEHIKLHHIEKGRDGQLCIQPLPSKRQYNLNQETAEVVSGSGESLTSGAMAAEDHTGYFQFLSSGELVIVTRRFCAFTCSVCSSVLPKPQIHLVATANQLLKAKPSGALRQVSIYLHLWDRKMTITDFKRDYVGNTPVAKQTLHVIDDYEDSVVNISFCINEEESQQQWTHALRPGRSDPIFPAERSFPLQELLCCHARDEPRCEEWLAESVQDRGKPSYDFQCFLDVLNVAHPSHRCWQEEEEDAAWDRLRKAVTLFIGDVSNNAPVGVSKQVPPQFAGYGTETQPTAKLSQWQQQHPHELPSLVTNTPFGEMEQGPSERPDLSDMPGWQPLSDEVRLDSVPLPRWRVSDPTGDTSHASARNAERRTAGRSVSCPQGLAGHACSGGEPGPHPQARVTGRMDGQWGRRGHLQEGRENFALPRDHDQYPGHAVATVQAPSADEEPWPKVDSSGALYQLPQRSVAEKGPQSDFPRGVTDRCPQESPHQGTSVGCGSPVHVHDQRAVQIPPDPGHLSRRRLEHPGAQKDDANAPPAVTGSDDRPQQNGRASSSASQTLNDLPETALADSTQNINMYS